jgi:hypothetical protein
MPNWRIHRMSTKGGAVKASQYAYLVRTLAADTAENMSSQFPDEVFWIQPEVEAESKPTADTPRPPIGKGNLGIALRLKCGAQVVESSIGFTRDQIGLIREAWKLVEPDGVAIAWDLSGPYGPPRGYPPVGYERVGPGIWSGK